MPSATMARAKRADEALRAEREASRRWGTDEAKAARDAKREATERRVREEQAETRRLEAGRRAVASLRREARYVLKGEGFPCVFTPADRMAEVDAAIGAAASTWDLDAAVAALRPCAYTEVGYAEALAAAADRRHCALLDAGTARSGGKVVAGKERAALAADAERLAKAARAEAKRSRRGQVRRTAAKPRLFGPRWTDEQIADGIAAWNLTVATFEARQGPGWRARRNPAQFGGGAPAPIAQPEPTPEPEEETPVLSDHPDFPQSTPLTQCRDQYAATMERHAERAGSAPEPPVAASDAPTIPQALADYLARLVAPQKQAFAAAMVAHLYHGAPKPESDADWAPKAEAKIRRYAGKGGK